MTKKKIITDKLNEQPNFMIIRPDRGKPGNVHVSTAPFLSLTPCQVFEVANGLLDVLEGINDER